MGSIETFDGREMRLMLDEPWTLDENGFLVLSRKQARDLRDHLTWRFDDEPEWEDG